MKKIFEQSSIGNIKLKNRLIRAATWEWMADDKGFCTDKLYNVYEDLAKGGVGAIITGYAYVIKEEQPNPAMMGAYDSSFIDHYKKLTDMVHDNGSKLIFQIVYGGPFTFFDADKRVIWGPSAIEHRATKVMPKEMTKEDIKTLIQAFGNAAQIAKEGGFDGVQFHAAHGYLLNLFLSPYYNQRTDEYGGSSENRARIIYEVYDEIRAKVGKDFPVLMKMNCSDFSGDKGQLFDETREICKRLSKNGIDAIEISGGPVFKAPKYEREPYAVEPGGKESYFAEYAKVIAKDISAPVILVGGNRSMDVIENLLNTSDIAFFSMSRPLLSEPDLVNKWKENRDYKPRCTSCQKCFDPSGNRCILDREEKSI